jgi:outer membrane immunogenic protein
MRKIAAAALLAATAFSAEAADLPVQAPSYKAPVAAQLYDWTGFYVGVNAGLGVGRDLTHVAAPGSNFFEVSYQSPFGALGGAQAGYNWQFGRWVLGLETDIQGADMRDNHTCISTCLPTNSLSFDQRLDWFGTARGRIGYATGPVLTYFTGGLAYGDIKTITTRVAPLGGPLTTTTVLDGVRTGYALGSGVEAALGGNWTGRIEYLFLDLGNQSTTNGVLTVSHEYREHIFRGGLNYRIGGNGTSAPVAPANWNGFYAGANAGSGVARDPGSFLFTSVPQITSSPLGFIGGVQAGYNWQAANWVFGVETDIQGSTQRDDKGCLHNCNPVSFAQLDQRLPWFGTARGRFGYSAGSTLFYATGGFAYGEVRTRIASTIGGLNTVDFANTKGGWTAGAGIESPLDLFGLFGPKWTAKTEYLYVDLGSTTNAFTNGGIAVAFNTRIQEHIFRSGLNYHFDTPVVAKY